MAERVDPFAPSEVDEKIPDPYPIMLQKIDQLEDEKWEVLGHLRSLETILAETVRLLKMFPAPSPYEGLESFARRVEEWGARLRNLTQPRE